MRLCAPFGCGIIAVCVLGPALCYAGEHPLPVNDKSQCLDCHEDRAAGENVHAAVRQGCAFCHVAQDRQGVTYVELKQVKSGLCFECHAPEVFLYPHLPYSSGMCARCHDPHSSGNRHLLKAKVNELCLNCHLHRADGVSSRYLPTIALAGDNNMGHPFQRHPVSKVKDLLTGDEMSCVSCHTPHGGAKLHQLKMASAIPEDALNQVTETNDICRKCHMRMWGLEDYAAGKKKNKKKAN